MSHVGWEQNRIRARAATFPIAVITLVAALIRPTGAAAFERQWHLGGGLGAASFAEQGVAPGPLAMAYAAYGLSDMFDLRASLIGSRHALGSQSFETLGISGGAAYKLDVLSFIPYAGLELGYYRFMGDTRPKPLAEGELGLSIDLGVDYVLSESFGLGLELRYQGFLGDPVASFTEAPLLAALLRAEYHFGF